ncbi:MAG: signal recognition particle-docking protein FtsY [Pirellulaceae bacterium]|nr:signal recognition particle-docking protein FtsY [Pirellulaceae bacterium]
MALWNPFNLFKKKEKPAPAVETPPETTPVAASPVVARPVLDVEIAPVSAPVAATPVPTQNSSTEASISTPVQASESAPTSGHSESLPIQSAPVPAAVPASSKDQAEVGHSTKLPVVPPTSDARVHVPFVEQKAPAQPVDFAAKISRRPTTEKSAVNPTVEESSGGLMGWFRSAIRKTAQVLNTDIRDLVGRDGRLVDDEFLQELFTHLIKTDMGVAAATEIRTAIHTQYRGRKVHLNELIDAAKVTIRDIMRQDEVRLTLADHGTSVIMVVGVNGSGKTTSIAKLANMFRQDGKSVVLGAGDTFRAAAVEQLRQWAGRIGADIVTGEDRSDPASVAFRATKHAVDHQTDVCIVDTAGRLQTQSHLMQELAKIRRVIDKVVPGAPHETLLVLDSTAGQNAISQARGFSEAAGCTGIILAKLDGTAKGGVAIPIRKEFNLPVKFIGFGETADAIAPFDVERYVDALFNID